MTIRISLPDTLMSDIELRSDDRDPWTAGGTPLNAGELPSGYDRA